MKLRNEKSNIKIKMLRFLVLHCCRGDCRRPVAAASDYNLQQAHLLRPAYYSAPTFNALSYTTLGYKKELLLT